MRQREHTLGEATLDVSGTFPGEAIRLPIQIAALHKLSDCMAASVAIDLHGRVRGVHGDASGGD